MKSQPKKRLGQHFLKQPGVLDRIIDYLGPSSEDLFLEIGAGHGELSSRLAPRVGKLIAVEIDTDCIPALTRTLADSPSAIIEHGDVLSLNPVRLLPRHMKAESNLRVAGNLPYNIATAIVERLLELPLAIKDMTFLVQLEVAERITAAPRTRQYGYFSVLCQHLADVRIGFKVQPGSFFPPPKVTSAIVTLRPLRPGPRTLSDHDLKSLVKASFTHRRKTLLNSLKRDPRFGQICESLISLAGMDPGRRAEELTVKEYEHLAVVYRQNFAT
jgi:16S rRNA (adenine1518-N6/adenine1519-N6)-dimethyltransferase